MPCEEPHVNEVYATFDLPDGDFPGRQELEELSEDGCMERFAEYTGVGYYETSLEVSYLFPTRESWSMGDRAVICAVSDYFRLLQGSVAGAGASYLAPVVGSCADAQFRIVDCAGEHESELFLVTEIGGDDYSSEEAIKEKARSLCLDAFAVYVGIEYEDSELDFLYTWPYEPMWAEGERGTLCAAYDPDGPLIGSIRGIAR